VSRDPASTNHRPAAVIHHPVAVHRVAHAQQRQPAVVLTSSTNPTLLPVSGHQLPVAISTIQLPPPVIGQPVNALPDYTLASVFQPDFGSRSGYGRNRNPEEDWVNGQRTLSVLFSNSN